MTQELLYTSAPRGLKPGSQGFCTVISTQSMSAPLAEALESLSGYRPVFAPGDPQANLNPVAWSHVKITAGGRACNVLSRVSDYGLDYSQRTNKIAHHIALDAHERPAGGPAWLLSQSGFMDAAWDGRPQLLPYGRRAPAGDVSGGVCSAWAEFTGDAGWAGVLAESFLADPERLVILLYEPGMNLLPLLVEATGLLPPERRWDVSFSTYFTSLPSKVSCTWRCILYDSPEANQSRRFVNALRLNLCKPLEPARGGVLVESARNGRSATIHTASAGSFAEETPPEDEDVLLEPVQLSPAPPQSLAAHSTSSLRLPPAHSGPAIRTAAPPPPPTPKAGKRTLADLNEKEAATWKSRRRVLLICSVCLLLVIAACVSIAVFLRNSPIQIPALRTVDVAQNALLGEANRQGPPQTSGPIPIANSAPIVPTVDKHVPTPVASNQGKLAKPDPRAARPSAPTAPPTGSTPAMPEPTQAVPPSVRVIPSRTHVRLSTTRSEPSKIMERLDMEVMKKFDLLLFLPHGADPKLTCKRKGDTWKIIQSGTQESGVASLREDGMLIWDSPPNTLGAQGLRLSMLRFVSGASVKEFVLHDVVEFKPTTVPSNDFGLSFEKCPAVPKTIIIRDLRIRHGTVECALPQLELQLIPNGKVVIHNKSDDLANALNIESVYFATKVEGTSKGKPLKVKFDLLRDDGSLKKDDEQRFEEIKGRIGQLDMALANSIKQMDVSKLGTAIQRMKEFEEKMNQPNPSMPTSRPNDAMEIQELKRKVAASRSEIQTLQERRDAREKQQADLRRALSKLSIVRGRVWYSVSYADETVEVELFSISASR